MTKAKPKRYSRKEIMQFSYYPEKDNARDKLQKLFEIAKQLLDDQDRLIDELRNVQQGYLRPLGEKGRARFDVIDAIIKEVTGDEHS